MSPIRDPAPPPGEADFLTGGGEMAARIRALDWTASPLGPPSGWPESLRSVVGLMLASRFGMFVAWGDSLGFLYNDAYAALLGAKHPHALGRPFPEVWPEIRDDIDPLVTAALAGETTYLENLPLVVNRHGFDEQAHFTFSYSPVRDPQGRVAGMFGAVTETTGHVVLEHRQAFQLDLEAQLREIDDPEAILGTAVEALGRHLGANRVGYSKVQPDESTIRLTHCYADGVEPLFGIHPIDSFGPEAIARQRRGETEACGDVRADPAQDPAIWAAIDTRAFVSVPLIRDGRLRASLYVNCREPRRWSAEDVRFIEDVALRTWAEVERASAERRLERERVRLAESEAKFHAIANSIDQMVWATRPDGHHDYFNERWYDYTGMAEGSTDGEAWNGLFHPDDQARAWERWRRSLESGEPYHIEYRLRHRSGQYRWVIGRAQCVRDEGGRITRWFGTCTDIQEIVEARDVLKRSQEELERQVVEQTRQRNRVWEMSRDLFAIMGFDGHLKAINPAWEATLGLDRATLLARPFPEQVHPDDHRRVEALIERLERGETVAGFEDRLRHADGSWRWISWTLVPEGDVFYAVGRDVTDEKAAAAELERAQEALRQSQKMEAMGQLTGGVAHDFNNLLTPIVGSLDMLQRQGVGGPREQRLIDGAMQSADRAKTLVQRLLAFARRQPLQTGAVDAAKLVAGIADLIASTVGPQIRVVVEAAAELPPATADANQLEMALLNLGVNARDAMPDGGTLRITADLDEVAPGHRSGLAPGRYVRLSVADTGLGMDEATLRRAVEPFFSTKGVGKGTGLGLSMVHGLASQLGGALSIRSEPGLGTDVELWLPLSTVPADAAQPAEPPAAVRGRGTALLVDDEELVRISTADMLGDIGYSVVEAQSAEEALRLIAGGLRPDVLVTDHLMPGMSGTELADAARASLPGVPVLVVSGYAEAEGLPADLPRLAKPFRKADLAASLAELGAPPRPAARA